MYINKMFWAGHLGHDAKSYPPTSPTGKFMVTFSIAQSKRSRRSDNSYHDVTTWLNCRGYYNAERHASLFPKLVKGAHIYIEGEFEVEQKVIEGVERTFPSLLVKEVQFLPKASRANESTPSESSTPLVPVRAEQQNPDAFNPAKFG